MEKWEVLAQRAGYKPRELAALCQISLRTLERHFRRSYGKTVLGWLREYRLSEAYRALLEGKAVKEVAFDFGYKQMSHFSREFKNHFGISPSLLLPRRSRDANLVLPRTIPACPQMTFTF